MSANVNDAYDIRIWSDDAKNTQPMMPPASPMLWGNATPGTSPRILPDLDHDAGDMAHFSGDCIAVLDWIAATGYPMDNGSIRIHSANPVGAANMKRTCRIHGWLVEP